MPLERLFHVDWASHAEAFRRDGVVDLADGVDPGFLSFLESCLAEASWRRGSGANDFWYMNVPEWVRQEFARAVSAVTGAPLERVVVVNSWFAAHRKDYHTAHLDDTWEQVAMLILLKVPNPRADLKLYNTTGDLPGEMFGEERRRHLLAHRAEILAGTPRRVAPRVGALTLFNAGEVYHEREVPMGMVHFRLAANTHGIAHPMNRGELMMVNSCPVRPDPFPERFRALFPEVRDRRYGVVTEGPGFDRFWDQGPSLSFRCRRKVDGWISRGRHIARRLGVGS